MSGYAAALGGPGVFAFIDGTRAGSGGKAVCYETVNVTAPTYTRGSVVQVVKESMVGSNGVVASFTAPDGLNMTVGSMPTDTDDAYAAVITDDGEHGDGDEVSCFGHGIVRVRVNFSATATADGENKIGVPIFLVEEEDYVTTDLSLGNALGRKCGTLLSLGTDGQTRLCTCIFKGPPAHAA